MRRLAFGLFLGLLIGCGRRPATSVAGTDDFPVTLTDALGAEVTVVRRPQRIVVLSPAATETLFAIGAGPQVVAVTTADSYPPEAKKLPTLGGFRPATISTEAVLAQRPDLVFAVRFHEPIVRSLRQCGLTVIALEPRSVEEVIANVILTGRVSGERAGAQVLADKLQHRLTQVRARAARLPQHDRVKVFYLLWDEPLQTVGPKSFIGQLIAEAGGSNLFADASQDYPRVSEEAILARRPDVIIAPDHGGADLTKRLSRRTGWNDLPALRHGRVHSIHEDLINRPGPRLIEGLEALQQVLMTPNSRLVLPARERFHSVTPSATSCSSRGTGRAAATASAN